MRWRSVLFLAAVCCLVAGLLGVLVHVIVTGQTVKQARTQALTRLEAATRAYTNGAPLPAHASLDPPALPTQLRALAHRGERGTALGTFAQAPTMWAAIPARGGKALAARYDYTAGAATIRGLDQAIGLSAALAIATTVGVGAFASSRVTRRLHHTADVARRISAGDLDARVADPRTDNGAGRCLDEIAAVSAALDAMATTLQGKLHSEQRFTADVAHELRTPLAGLHVAAGLLPPGRPTEMVTERIQSLNQLTEDLLEISRLDSQTEQAELDFHQIADIAERAVRASGTPTEVRILRGAWVETDRRRLERVLGNLIINAHRHGTPPVTLTVDGPVLTVRDHGAGYPDYLLESGPRRFHTSRRGKGHGLGLTIATGQARLINAELHFANAPDGGALTTLTLPTPTDTPQPPPEPGT
ncbi:HAMP domain-containing sensor histidine kinase [Streptomyces halobius]|uniref:HAMP domain-containing sensor histidine kinase n=1 Tax=Streptomyces halobius TaxID=2879846 RepID=UPI0029E7FA00|nr:HAMP domain-containing sensor histidine kinase [Streptomyces halobius]